MPIFQMSDTVRSAMADAMTTAIGASPVLTLRTGSAPANCAAADSGTVIATITLPSTWMTSASAGVKNLAGGAWSDLSADNTGTIGHWRLKVGSICHLQGDATLTGGGGSMTFDAVAVNNGQQIQVTSFQFTQGNG